MRLLVLPLLLIGSLQLCLKAAAQTENKVSVTLVVQDVSGGRIKGAQVDIGKLDYGETDIAKTTTNESGETLPLMVSPGLFRAVATVPGFKTQVQEFLVSDKPSRVLITLDVLPSDTNDEIVHLEASRLKLKVVTSDGRPAAGARMLARDRAATPSSERWYTTNDLGKATIEAISNPVVVVVIFGDIVVVREFSSKPGHEITLIVPEE